MEKNFNYRMDATGHLCAKNLSAYWIPELAISEIIRDTTYIVTGSFEGRGDFLRKLERIAAKNSEEKLENTYDK